MARGQDPPSTATAHVVLERSLLRQLLGQPDFYTACPCFAGFREVCVAAYGEHVRLAAELECPDCHEAANIDGYITAFADALRATPAEQSRCLAEFLSRRLRQRVRSVELRYRNGHRVEKWVQEWPDEKSN